MREIKFRAWHNKAKHIRGHYFEPGMIYDGTPGDCIVWKNQGQDIVDIMQFTGLRDKNGKEIYEGDIVRPSHPNVGNIEPRIVAWDSEQTCWFLKSDYLVGLPMWEFDDFEVIGNIYEDANLRNGSASS